MNVAKAPGQVNFTAFLGQDFSHTLTFSTIDPETEVKTPQDLTGQTARMQVRPYVGAPAILDLVSPADLVVGDEAGTIEIVIARADLEAFELGKDYRYDLKTYLDGKARRRVEGTITVQPGITEDE